MKFKTHVLFNTYILFFLNIYNVLGKEPNTERTAVATNLSTYQPDMLFDIDDLDIDGEQKQECETLLSSLLNKFKYIHPEAIKLSLNSYNYLLQQNKIEKQNIITIVDFSKPSNVERLFVIDIKNKKLIHKSLCAHGKNTGENYATSFSNDMQSFQSSLGVFIANETYIGTKGFSLKLDGQEEGINSNARERGIVIHGANYVSYDFIQKNGRLGRSQGCPALPIETNAKIIETIKGGSCFFIFHPNSKYTEQSAINKSYDDKLLNSLLANYN